MEKQRAEGPPDERLTGLVAAGAAAGGLTARSEQQGKGPGQAILAEGGTLPDPAAFSRRLAELLVEATGT